MDTRTSARVERGGENRFWPCHAEMISDISLSVSLLRKLTSNFHSLLLFASCSGSGGKHLKVDELKAFLSPLCILILRENLFVDSGKTLECDQTRLMMFMTNKFHLAHSHIMRCVLANAGIIQLFPRTINTIFCFV